MEYNTKHEANTLLNILSANMAQMRFVHKHYVSNISILFHSGLEKTTTDEIVTTLPAKNIISHFQSTSETETNSSKEGIYIEFIFPYPCIQQCKHITKIQITRMKEKLYICI